MWTEKKKQSISQVRIRIPDDNGKPDITGCCFMPDGKAVLCDYYNYQIKILDTSWRLFSNLELSSRPFDVSAHNDTDIITTIPEERQLQILAVTPQLKTIRTIQLDTDCWGVDVFGGEIYITCVELEKGEIRVLDIDGNERRRICKSNNTGTYMFKDPNYIAVSAFSGKIYVTDSLTRILTCLTSYGQLVYQYKDEEVQDPAGILVESADNIHLCDFSSHTVHIITADGRKHGTLLSLEDGLNGQRAVAYRSSDNTLMVGCMRMEKLPCIQLT